MNPLVHAQEAPANGLTLVDAVRLTLERQPGIKLAEQQVQFANGTLEAALGDFDLRWGSTLSASRDKTPLLRALRTPGVDESRVDGWNYEVEARKLFRGGLIVTPSADLTRYKSNLSSITENRSRVSFTLRQPLLRGKGEDGVGAPSRAASFDRDATALDLDHVVSLSVLDTVSAYWRYVAELRRFQIARDSETRFVDLQKSAEQLLAAREIAAVDIKQLSAVVASRRLSRLEAEQSVQVARVRLGVVAGVDAAALGTIGEPGNALPAVDSSALNLDMGSLIAEALAQRSDLRASRLRQSSASVLLGASRNFTRPALDLVVGAGYQGEAERTGLRGFLDPLVKDVSGPSATAALVFGWPGANRTALGRLAENQALLRQSEIVLADLERRIGMQVLLALSNVSKSAARVAAARDACALYRETLAAERQRQQLGLSSLLDVINTEERLNDSLTEEVSAELDYAEAVAALRFETGTLMRRSATGHEIDFTLLTTPPLATPGR